MQIVTQIRTARANLVAALSVATAQAAVKVTQFQKTHAIILAAHNLTHEYLTLMNLQQNSIACGSGIELPVELHPVQTIKYPVAKGTTLIVNRRGLDALLVYLSSGKRNLDLVNAALSADAYMSKAPCEDNRYVCIDFIHHATRDSFCEEMRLMITTANAPEGPQCGMMIDITGMVYCVVNRK